MASRFFVLQVITGEESRYLQLARQAMERAMDHTTRLWWPQRKLVIRRKGKRVPSLAPLFPGYVIVEAPEIDESRLRTLRSCHGFIRFLKDNTDIQPLRGKDLDMIRHFLSFGEVVQQSRVSFDENDRIVVQDGPLKGLEGRIVKVDKRKGRAKVRLTMYEDSFLIDLGFEVMAEPADSESTDVEIRTSKNRASEGHSDGRWNGEGR